MFCTTFRKFALLFAMAFSLVPLSLFAGTNGKVTGIVKDKETGDALPGVNIILDGTTMGAATNAQGEFTIINVPAGVYTLSTSMIGYTKVTKQNVRVLPDFTTRVDFDLSPESLGGEEVVIVAERPLIQKDQTMTMTVTSSEEIKNLPVRGFQAAANLGVGVVVNNTRNLEGGTGNVNVRGGRPNETGVYVDGFQQNNLLTGISNAAIPNGAVEELIVVTGGFDAEYGRNQSGVIQVTTKSGSTRYSGNIEYVNDRPMFALDKGHYYGYDVYSGGFGGPLIPGNNKIKFYVSAEARDITDAEPSVWGHPDVSLSNSGLRGVTESTLDTVIFKYDRDGNVKFKKGARPKNSQGYGINSDRGISGQLKLTYDILSNLRIDLAANYGETYRRVFIMDRVFAPDNQQKREIKTGNIGLTGTYTLNQNSYFDLGVNYFFSDRKIFTDAWGYNLELYPGTANGGTGSPYYRGENFMFDVGRGSRTFRRDEPSYIAFKGNYVNQLDKHNQLKFGFDYFNHNIRYLNVRTPDNPVSGENDYVGYEVVDINDVPTIKKVNKDDLENLKLGPAKPYSFAIYLQDKVEMEGLVLRAGLRYDLFNAGVKRVKDLSNPTGQGVTGNESGLGPEDFTKAKNDIRFSPRFSVSFPISERTQFRLSYGKFFQQPNLQNLYLGPRFLEQLSLNAGVAAASANPNLKPENSTQYEVGFRRAVNDHIALDVSAFYKDISNLVQLVAFPSTPNGLILYTNDDEGVVQGITFAIEARRMGKFSGRLNYTLSSARGTGSGEATGFNAAWLSFAATKFNAPLNFDQRHTINASVDIRNSKDEGPSIGGSKWLENSGVNFVLNAGSGLPYTPSLVSRYSISTPGYRPIGRRNSANAPWTFRIDMKADKTIYLTKNMNVNLYVQVLNLLDRKNIANVWAPTGRPDNDGFLESADGQSLSSHMRDVYSLQYKEGFNWDTPRQGRLGILFNF